MYVCISQASMNIAVGNTEGTDSVRCTLTEIDFENARLLEVAKNLPNINGLCAGKLPDGDSAGASDDSDNQYDLLLYDDRAVYGYSFAAQKSDSGSAGEELFTWMDSDINGYYVSNLYLLEDGRLYITVSDWINEDRVIVTPEELFSIADRYPGTKTFDGVTKEEVMQYLMMFNENTFIDWDTGTCHFDSEEFKAVLEYVNQFPDSVEIGREEEPLSDKIQKGEVLFAIAELYPPFIFQEPAYYNGQKRIDDVVSIIQNRVRLYVNENT